MEEKYIYWILNIRYDIPVSMCICFPRKLNFTELRNFESILKGIKHEYYDDLDCTTYDIINEALQRFKRDHHICGVITDSCDGMIFF